MSARAGRWIAAALALWGVACAGCDQAAWILVKTVGPWVPEDKVEAEYRLSGQSVLVLVDVADPALASAYPRLELMVSDGICKALEQHGAAGPIVPARSLAAARRTEPDFARWSVVEAGRYFNVDVVLHVELYEFRLADSPGGNVFHGYAESAVRVVLSETGKQAWPVLASARLVTAETLPDVQPEDPAEVETILAGGLADKIARYFYTYNKNDLPMRPKVK
jgi:hypothetical protein